MTLLFWIFSLIVQTEAAEWKELPEFSCALNETSCFQKSKKVLQEIFVPYNVGHVQYYSDPKHLPMGNKQGVGTGRYLLQNRPSETAFILIHGLFGDDMQFATTAAYLYAVGQNVLHLVLPGHGNNWQNAPNVQPTEWREFVKRAVNIARPLGRRVIVLGQSTGGLLAVLQALSVDSGIDGLILMEPALKVQPGKEGVACFTRLFGQFAQDIPNLAKLFGYDVNNIPKSVSPQMACRVAKMRSEFLKEFELNEDPQDSLNATVALSQRISVPTLVMSPQNDSVVRKEDNLAFAQALERRGLGMYFEYPDSRFDHGMFNLFTPSMFHTQIESYLKKFFGWDQLLARKAIEAEQLDRLIYLQLAVGMAKYIQDKYRENAQKTMVDRYIRNLMLQMATGNARHQAKLSYLTEVRFRREFQLRDLRPIVEFLPSDLQNEVREFLDAYMDLILIVDKFENLPFAERKNQDASYQQTLEKKIREVPPAVSENLEILKSKIKSLREQY